MAELTAKEIATRDNRYEVRPDRPLEAVIQRTTINGVETITGRVVELSHSGAKLSITGSIPFEETVSLRIVSRDMAFAIDVDVKICWGRPGPKSTWQVGCLVTPPIKEETFDRLAALGYIDRRQAVRTSIRMHATVQWELQSSNNPVTLTNVSTTGFGMRSAYCPAVGQRLLLSIEGPAGEQLALPAQVEWTSKAKRGYSIGCCLLDGDDVRQIVAAAKRRMETRPPREERSPPRSPWMFAALMAIAFIGPSAIYGMYMTLTAPAGKSAAQLARVDIADQPPAPETIVAPATPEVGPSMTVAQVVDDVDGSQPEPMRSESTGAAAGDSAVVAADNPLPATTAAQPRAAVPPGAETESVTGVASRQTESVDNPAEISSPPISAPSSSADTSESMSSLEPSFPVILAPDADDVAPPKPTAEVTRPSTAAHQPAPRPPQAESTATVQETTIDEDTRPARAAVADSTAPPLHVLLPPSDGISDTPVAVSVAEGDPTEKNPRNDISAASATSSNDSTGIPPAPPRNRTALSQDSPETAVRDAETFRRAKAYFDTSYAQYRRGRTREAVQSLDKASKLDDTNPLYLYIAALLQHQLNETDAAMRMVERAAELERTHAIDNWGRAVQRYQGRPRVWLERARSQALSRRNG